MPPDRHTAQRFSEAVASGAPLSSSGGNHPPSLERGKACLTCRRRRVKCDGARPICGRCSKSARAHGEDPADLVCVYDASVPKRQPKDKTGGGEGSQETEDDRVAQLAAEVAALKQLLAGQVASQPPPSQPFASTSAVTLDQPTTSLYSFTTPSISSATNERFTSLPSTFPASSSTTSGIPVNSAPSPQGFDPSSFFAAPTPGASGTGSGSTDFSFLANAGAANSLPTPGSSSSFPSTIGHTPPGTTGGLDSSRRVSFSGLSDLADLATSTSAPPPSGTGLSSYPLPPSIDLSFSSTTAATSAAAGPTLDFSSDGFDWSLLPLSYSPTLPPPTLLDKLLTVFFTKQHLATNLINESSLRSSLLLPSSNPRRPLDCLLHAICATAGLMVSASFLEEGIGGGGLRYWESQKVTGAVNDLMGGGIGAEGRLGGTKGARDGARGWVGGTAAFSEYHAKRAEEFIDPSFRAGRQLLQVVQTAALLTFVAYTAGRFADIWLLGATASRLAVITGLNHLRPSAPSSSSKGGVPTGATRLRESAMLPPARDEEEFRERVLAFWAVFGADRMTAAATDWCPTLSEEHITTLLPTLEGMPSSDWASHPLTSPLCLSNPSFFLLNPSHLVGTDQVYIKSLVLLGRVCTFLQRAPEPVGAGYAREEGEEEDLRETSAFRKLERDIFHFQQSLSRDLQYSAVLQSTGKVDNRLLMTATLSQVVIILMHEPWCIVQGITADDPSLLKCLGAAKAIVASVYEVSNSSTEIGLLASYLNWCWAVAGRTLVRALALASRRGDLRMAAQLAADVKALIAAMHGNRSVVGAVTASVLQRLLADPFQILPDSPPASSRSTQNFSSRFRDGGNSPFSDFNAANSSGGGGGGGGGFTNHQLHCPVPAFSQQSSSSSSFPAPQQQQQHNTAGQYPGSIWEILDDKTPPEGEEGNFPVELEEFAKRVVEQAGGQGGVGWMQ
ncbi:hypothetical protein JCM8547_004397 [Rhodosporidiobolus lusitaniae]